MNLSASAEILLGTTWAKSAFLMDIRCRIRCTIQALRVDSASFEWASGSSVFPPRSFLLDLSPDCFFVWASKANLPTFSVQFSVTVCRRRRGTKHGDAQAGGRRVRPGAAGGRVPELRRRGGGRARAQGRGPRRRRRDRPAPQVRRTREGATRVARRKPRVGGRFRLRRAPRGGLGAVRRAPTGGTAREEGIYSFPRSSAALRRPRGPTAAATSSLTRRAPAPARPRCRLAAC